jgi:hypothetical protein
MIKLFFLKILKNSFYCLLLLITFLVTENVFAQVEFIENKGQWDQKVKYMSEAGSGSYYQTEKGFNNAQYKHDYI